MRSKGLLGAAAIAASCLAAACVAEPPSSTASSGAGTPGAGAVVAVTPAVLEHGKGLYRANCAACHGEQGKGDGPAAGVMKPPPRDHTDRAYMSTLTDEDLKKVIQMGGAIKGKPLMPSNPQIRGTDLEALVAYTRSLSAGSGGGHTSGGSH